MTHNEAVDFLTLQGWEYNPNCKDEYVFHLDGEKHTLKEALEIQKMKDPESYREFELVTNLDSRYMKMFTQYMDE